MTFTVKLIFQDAETQNLINRLYGCRQVDASENGELILRGLSGTDEDVDVYVNGKPYTQVFVTDANGKTVHAYRLPAHLMPGELAEGAA